MTLSGETLAEASVDMRSRGLTLHRKLFRYYDKGRCSSGRGEYPEGGNPNHPFHAAVHGVSQYMVSVNDNVICDGKLG